MDKKVKDWYNEVPHEKLKEFLFKNLRIGRGDDEVTSLPQAINRGFTWGDTPQGSHFWNSIYESLLKNSSPWLIISDVIDNGVSSCCENPKRLLSSRNCANCSSSYFNFKT